METPIVFFLLSLLATTAVVALVPTFWAAFILNVLVALPYWTVVTLGATHGMQPWMLLFAAEVSLGFIALWNLKAFTVQMLARRRTSAAFGQYLSPGMVADLAKHPGRLELHTEEKHVDFIVLQVADDPGAAISANFERAFRLIVDAGATIENVTQSIAIATFGALPIEKSAASGARQALVQRLIAELGDRLRVVHGSATCLVGNYGSSQRFSFGSLIPNFNAVLGDLLALKFGMARELGQ